MPACAWELSNQGHTATCNTSEAQQLLFEGGGLTDFLLQVLVHPLALQAQQEAK